MGTQWIACQAHYKSIIAGLERQSMDWNEVIGQQMKKKEEKGK